MMDNDKKTRNVKMAFAICFLALTTIQGITSVGTYISWLLRSKPKLTLNDCPRIKSFKEIYPFDNCDERSSTSSSVSAEKVNFFPSYCNVVYRETRHTAQFLIRRNPLSNSFRYLVLKFEEIIGKDLFENGNEPIVRLSNGTFTHIFPYSCSQASLENILDFSIWLKERNIQLLHLFPTCKFDDSVSVFPPSIPHGYARMVEEYKTFLIKNDVPYIDAKDILLAENPNFYSWFYKTDHHWNVFAGLTVAEATAKKLNDELNFATDVNATKRENFILTNYPNTFYGSMYDKIGTSPEDIGVYYQRKESCFHIEIPSEGIWGEGSFKDTLIDHSCLTSSYNSYASFLYGDRPLIRVENKDCTNGTRVLVLKRSNADIVCPYLACTVQYLDVIDPRYFDGSIRTFIQQTKPNVVIFCTYAPDKNGEAFWRLK